MFSKTAKYYDAIYSFKDYNAEATSIRSIIKQEHPAARSILDVDCGTGEHAKRLATDFAVDGIDLEPEFIDLARSPAGVEHVLEDHELALYTVDQLFASFKSAGLVASHDPVGLSGRGLYIARRPAA